MIFSIIKINDIFNDFKEIERETDQVMLTNG